MAMRGYFQYMYICTQLRNNKLQERGAMCVLKEVFGRSCEDISM